MGLSDVSDRRRIIRVDVLCRILASVLLLAGSATKGVLLPCTDTEQREASGIVTITGDCTWTGQLGARVVAGQKQGNNDITGPPALTAASAVLNTAADADAAPLRLSYLILIGFKLPNPKDATPSLVPAGVGSSSVSLQDVRILVDSTTLQQHLQFFRQQPHVTFYTDNSTFLHVNYFATSTASWQSVGLLLADDLQDARSTSSLPVSTGNTSGQLAHSRYNYVMAANNQTLTHHMQRLGAQAGPISSLIYIDSNVTMSKPPVPADGITVDRPMALVGLVTANTSFDWHMQVNQIMMNGIWSNLTVDSLELENFAPGDAKSAEVARPLSVSSANNFWPLYYDRSQNRLLIINCTFVVGGQSELDYYLYWATVYHSSLPYFKQLANFIKDVIGVRSWELGTTGQDDKSVLVNMLAGSCTVKNTLFTVTPVVAPPLPRPAVDPKLQLQAPQKSPLVTAVSSAPSFKDQLMPLGPSEAGRTHVVLLRSNISLPAVTGGSNAGSDEGVPAAGIPVPQPLTILGDASNQEEKQLNLGFARDLLDVPADATREQVQVQHLVLRGLAQGPAAASATSLSSADVWTIALWAFARSSEGSVALSACTLELPPPEYDALKQQAGAGGGQVIFKLSGPHGLKDEDLFVLNDVVISDDSMKVGSLKGHGLTGANLVLLSSAAAANIPGGYYWPGGSLPTVATVAPGHLSKSALTAAIVVPILLLVVAATVLAVVWLMRRRRHLQQKASASAEKGQYDMYRDDMDCVAPAGIHGKDVALESSNGISISSKHSISTTDGSRPICKPSDMLVAWHAGAAMQHMASVNEIKATADAEAQEVIQSGFNLLSDSHQRQLWSMARQLDSLEQQQEQPPKDAALIQVLPPSSIVQRQNQFVDQPTTDGGKGAAHVASQGCGTQKTNGTNDSAKSMSEWRTGEQLACTTDVEKQLPPLMLPLSGTVFHSMDRTQLSTAAKHLRQRAIEQGFTHSHTEGLDSAAALASCDQHLGEQQSLQEVVQANPAAAATTPADVARQGAIQGSPKPWQRVSYAISLLQQDITQRRLEAAYAEAQTESSADIESAQEPSVSTAGGPIATQDPVDSAEETKSKGSVVCRTGSGSTQRSASIPQLQLLDIIGRGSFASVHRAIWRGRCVAVKVLHLPADAMEGASDLAAALQTREKMAVMEAVVSITMSHPNIVQMYTFTLRPLPPPVDVDGMLRRSNSAKQQQQHATADGANGWELQLVMEYCAEGSLRQALNQQRLVDPQNSYRLPALHLVLSLAHDIACAMLHLHSENLIHGDLKASNVLLSVCNAPLLSTTTSSMVAGDGYPVHSNPMNQAVLKGNRAAGSICGRGTTAEMTQSDVPCIALLATQQAAQGGRLVAKVADFGLSLSLAPGDTHVSHMHAGTLTHMAPELLLHGHASKPSDVYAFGILFWELITGRKAFQGVPLALLGHNVAHLRWRPGWLPDVPVPLRSLVEECWAQEAAARPCFEHVLLRLEHMLQLSPNRLRSSAVLCTKLASVAADPSSQQAGPSAHGRETANGTQAAAAVGGACSPVLGLHYWQGDGNGNAAPETSAFTGDWTLPKKQQHQAQLDLKQQVLNSANSKKTLELPSQQLERCSPVVEAVGGVPAQPQQQSANATAAAGASKDLTGDWTLPGR